MHKQTWKTAALTLFPFELIGPLMDNFNSNGGKGGFNKAALEDAANYRSLLNNIDSVFDFLGPKYMFTNEERCSMLRGFRVMEISQQVVGFSYSELILGLCTMYNVGPADVEDLFAKVSSGLDMPMNFDRPTIAAAKAKLYSKLKADPTAGDVISSFRLHGDLNEMGDDENKPNLLSRLAGGAANLASNLLSNMTETAIQAGTQAVGGVVSNVLGGVTPSTQGANMQQALMNTAGNILNQTSVPPPTTVNNTQQVAPTEEMSEMNKLRVEMGLPPINETSASGVTPSMVVAPQGNAGEEDAGGGDYGLDDRLPYLPALLAISNVATVLNMRAILIRGQAMVYDKSLPLSHYATMFEQGDLPGNVGKCISAGDVLNITSLSDDIISGLNKLENGDVLTQNEKAALPLAFRLIIHPVFLSAAAENGDLRKAFKKIKGGLGKGLTALQQGIQSPLGQAVLNAASLVPGLGTVANAIRTGSNLLANVIPSTQGQPEIVGQNVFAPTDQSAMIEKLQRLLAMQEQFLKEKGLV